MNVSNVTKAVADATAPIKEAIAKSVQETEGDVKVIVPVVVVIVGNRIIVDREWDWEKESET